MATAISEMIENEAHSEISPEIAALGLFVGVDLEGLEEYLDECPMLDLRSGEVLIAANQPVNSLFLLLEGRLNVHLPPKMEAPNSTIEPGEAFGEALLFSQKPCQMDIIAATDSRVMAIKEETLFALINNSDEFTRNFLFMTIQNLRGAEAVARERQQMQERFRRETSTDVITGLHNRRWLDEMLTRQIVRSSKDDESMCVIMIDIDGYNSFGDVFGEVASEQVLYATGQILQKNCRPTDLLARFDKDRFIVILPDTVSEDAWSVSERIRDAIENNPIEIPGECILPPVTASIGIVEKEAVVGAEKLIALAVSAVKRAKERGGNQLSQ